MIEVAIIEDESLAAEDLEKTLESIDEGIVVKHKMDSVSSAKKWLSENKVDLIFSDIQLGDGLSFEVFDDLKLHTPIIMTTAFDQYAIRAFKENSIDYLLKPVDRDELINAVGKYKEWKAEKKEFDIDTFLSALNPSSRSEYRERFIITLGEKIVSIPEGEVSYFFSEDRYTFLVTKEGRQHIVNSNLGDLEESLNPKKFYRINRKFIISYGSIQNMVAFSKSRVKVEIVPPPPNAMDVIVSVERSGAFKKWLNR